MLEEQSWKKKEGEVVWLVVDEQCVGDDDGVSYGLAVPQACDALFHATQHANVSFLLCGLPDSGVTHWECAGYGDIE